MVIIEHPTDYHVSFCVGNAKYTLAIDVVENDLATNNPYHLNQAVEFLSVEGAPNPQSPIHLTVKELTDAYQAGKVV
jgi:hypothetical protein